MFILVTQLHREYIIWFVFTVVLYVKTYVGYFSSYLCDEDILKILSMLFLYKLTRNTLSCSNINMFVIFEFFTIIKKHLKIFSYFVIFELIPLKNYSMCVLKLIFCQIDPAFLKGTLTKEHYLIFYSYMYI